MRDIAGVEKTTCWSLVDEIVYEWDEGITTLNPLFEEILTTDGGSCEMF
jgi:hypothetical protein